MIPNRLPHERPRPRPVEPRGPWGTSRYTERRFGYPRPHRDHVAELEERLDLLEWLVFDGSPADER
jgi:hypothetical protein